MTGSLAITFSLIGGVSTFIIIYFSLVITKFQTYSWEFYILIALVLLNPMIWIMSNRYMPDLMGLSLFISSFYFFTCRNKNRYLIAGFLSGLLLGTRLSYFPLLLFPYIKTILSSNKKENTDLILSSLIGCLVWLIPMTFITGPYELFSVAQNQTVGHFSDFGGTMLTENSWFNRLKYFFHTIWSDGLGGFWSGRTTLTIYISISIIPMLFFSYQWASKELANNKTIKLLIFSILLYALWALCFQNVIYKSRHVMPIVFLLIILLSYGQSYIAAKSLQYKFLSFIFLIPLALLSINLSIQHKSPTAISKIKDYLLTSNNDITVITNPLVNYYLTSSGIDTEFIDIENNINGFKNEVDGSRNYIMIGSYHKLIDNNFTVSDDTTFYHNPYVNRMWSTISLYHLELKK